MTNENIDEVIINALRIALRELNDRIDIGKNFAEILTVKLEDSTTNDGKTTNFSEVDVSIVCNNEPCYIDNVYYREGTVDETTGNKIIQKEEEIEEIPCER